ncbi:peptidoglycan DD-metalloendopeptidase family protein [Flavobacteriaceae bacterium]|nr:peptidoglycan DD-metalloendopeptidase family protein [Flavobacteriaceae bacterium]MDB4497317.1 peptidoglycan DD-metalloendopeptidase family protein [Flavobacteriaceae bacterium]MDB4559802.1 peptidoglycan DD-metalloendopeptidase family protein [Flavobacteriaceae bacterium]MDC3285898.1 peptidoglycan DD-metalloendopeptidase family protein [Flavobacteriaceae bacterium]
MKKFSILLFVLLIVTSCGNDNQRDDESSSSNTATSKPKIIHEFGYTLNNYKVIKDTIKKGESFGIILDRHHVYYPKINAIAKKIKDTFDVRRIRAGIPYMILASKDTLEKAEVFIYKNSKSSATIVDFKDSTIIAYTYRKPIKIIEKEVAGKIYSTLSEAMDSLHLNPNLTYNVADIYAWTLDFGKLQRGDQFKLIYEEKFIDDSVFVGYGKVKAALFDHNNRDFYAYRFVPDSIKKIPEYYDDQGNMLRSQFLRSPIKFQYRVSSRFNLRRKIAYYGRVKPHKGTDFAAKVGTPIMATANGKVTESRRKGGNGNYVKIRHNNTYSTQYLHMSRRKVKRGQYVKQGDIIGYVGMTGNTSGPHVCYRFWKNGRQVDPFKQKLPAAKPLKKSLKPSYLKFIKPLEAQLDKIDFTK